MTRKHSSFRGRISRDAQRQQSERSNYGYLDLSKGAKIYNVESGSKTALLDFLPYVVTDKNHPCKNEDGDAAVGELFYRRPFKIHRNVGDDNETVVCPKSVGLPCPICEHQKKRFAEGADKEETKELYARPRSLYAVVPLELEGIEEVPHVWDMSDKLFQETLVAECEINPDYEVFPDLEEGLTAELSFKWTSFGKNSKPFPETRAIKFYDRDPYDESILDEVPDLDNILKILSYTKIYNMFFGLDEEEDGGALTPEDEIPEKTTRRRKSLTPVEPDTKEDASERITPQRGSVSSGPEKPPTRRTRPSRTPVAEEKETPPVRRTRPPKEEKADAEEKCPHGLRFGIDAEDFDKCDTCEIWQECLDAKNAK